MSHAHFQIGDTNPLPASGEFYRLLNNIKFCKQFGPRSGPTERRAWSGSMLFFLTLMLYLI